MITCRDRIDACLQSRLCQAVAVAAAFLTVGALHSQNDGLWYQGDAPRHGANGFFWWDLLGALPADPTGFALQYYARYPVIAPTGYPPLFYVFEGLAYHLFGPSPYAARFLVLIFGVLAGLYTMAWARRWVEPRAGWAGAFLAFLPAVVLWSNAVMLNVPAMALGLAGLYHFRRWSEEGRGQQLGWAAIFLGGLLLTYYPGVSVVCVCMAWTVLRRRAFGSRWRSLAWVAGAAALAAVPLLLSVRLAPVYASRHLPAIGFLTNPKTWTYYFMELPELVGPVALTLGLAGLAAGLLFPHWRAEAARLCTWIVVLILSLSVLTARDSRYILPVAPAFVIAVAIGLTCAARRLPAPRPEWQAALLATGLAAGLCSAAAVHIPRESGFLEVATYLQQHAPHDAVLYDGYHDGLFGFYARALDPHFQRRVMRADNFLYHFGPAATFDWVETSNVASTDDVVNTLRTRSGCRWVAIEVGRNSEWAQGQRLLRRAVERPEFELVRSFPVTSVGARRVDLYRLIAPVTPVASVNLYFPSYSQRAFEHVVPIAR